MGLNASGPISIGGATAGQSVELELGMSGTALASLNDANFRSLAGVASGAISLSDFYGKASSASYIGAASTGTVTMNYPAGVQSGDHLFMGLVMVNTPTVPTGWTQIGTTQSFASAPGVKSMLVFRVCAGETSVTLQANFVSSAGVAVMAAYRNVNNYNGVTGWSHTASGTSIAVAGPNGAAAINVICFFACELNDSGHGFTSATGGNFRLGVPANTSGLGAAIGDILNTGVTGGQNMTFVRDVTNANEMYGIAGQSIHA